jgi:sugar lactone lactonase YvrE
MAPSSVEPVLSARARLGECPLWDGARQRLFWVDIFNHRVHQLDPGTGDDRYFDLGDAVCCIVLTKGDRLLAALRDRLAFVDADTGAVQPLLQFEFSRPDTRFNDGSCDPQGRLWVGSASTVPGRAALYRFDPDGTLHIMETGLTTTNGPRFSPDGKTFYLTDSPARRIYAYRFDAATGSIADRRVLVDLDGEVGEPDGTAVDASGHRWCALWGGWCVVHFDANGREVERLPMPVQCPTCPAFGGRELTELYITSASVGLSQAEIQRGHQAGDVFHVSGVPRGLAAHPFDSSLLAPERSTGEAHAVRPQ